MTEPIDFDALLRDILKDKPLPEPDDQATGPEPDQPGPHFKSLSQTSYGEMSPVDQVELLLAYIALLNGIVAYLSGDLEWPELLEFAGEAELVEGQKSSDPAEIMRSYIATVSEEGANFSDRLLASNMSIGKKLRQVELTTYLRAKLYRQVPSVMRPHVLLMDLDIPLP